MSDILVAHLNYNFKNQFSYLKTYEINYFTKENVCRIIFLYPENLKVISAEQKQRITEFLIERLKLNAKIEIKFKKSYLEKKIIVKCVYEILKNHFASLASLVSESEIDVKIKNKSEVYIKIPISEKYLKNLEIEKINLTLIEILEKNFCAKFKIDFKNGIELDFKKIESKQKEELLKKLSDVKITPRYEVFDVVKIFGREIEPFPEFMENLTENKMSVILAGILDNLTKKFYKRFKGKKEVEKTYYSFILKEVGSFKKINCIYFCPKSNITKVDKLKNKDKILVIANIKKEKNNYITAYIKSLSLCDISEKNTFIEEAREPIKFLNIFPEKIISIAQKKLFEIKKKYSENIQNNKFVVFDVETTGLDASSCELIEIGAVKIENGVFTEKFQTLIKPKNKITALITEINGITNEMTMNAPLATDVIQDFYLFCKDAVLAGYNVGFDMKFIEKTANEVGLKFENEIQDVMLLAQQNIHIKNYKLKSVVKSLGISLTNAHRAYNDAFATAEVLLKLNIIN